MSNLKKTPVDLETLIVREKWDELRPRLGRIGRNRMGEIIHYILEKPNVPPDIFTLLFSRLSLYRTGKKESYLTREREEEYEWGSRLFHEEERMVRRFWGFICNNEEAVLLEGIETFSRILSCQRLETFRIILGEYLSCFETLTDTVASQAIYKIWQDFIPGFGVCHSYELERIAEVRRNMLEKGNLLLNVTSLEALHSADGASADQLREVWEKTLALVRATGSGPLIRRLIMMWRVPKITLWFSLRMKKDQLTIRDEEGKVPLHYAAQQNLQFRSEWKLGELPTLNYQVTKCLAEMVLDACPDAAAIADAKGRLPLSLLLKAHGDNTGVDGDNTEVDTVKCAAALIRHAPEALLRADPDTRLLPFMTAASRFVTFQDQSPSEERGTHGLELIYRVLRSDPLVVANGIHSPWELNRKLQSKLDQTKHDLNAAWDLIAMLQKENENLRKSKLVVEDVSWEKPTKRSKNS